MGTCYRQFRRAFFHEIDDFSMKSSLDIKNGFASKRYWYFHFGSDTSAMLNSSSMKTSIQLSQDDLPNKILMLLPNSLYRAARFENFEGIFWVFLFRQSSASGQGYANQSQRKSPACDSY